MISKIFTVRDSERGMSSHHQPSFCNLKVRKNGLQLGRQRQQSVCERCIRIAGVPYLVIYARCHTQLCRKSRRSSLNSCGDMVGTYTRRRRKSLLYLWRKTKGEKKNDQNSVCLPRQYLEKSQKSLIYQWFCSSSRCLLHHDYTIFERALNDISEVTCFYQNNGQCPKDSTIILQLLLVISPSVCD